jgi:predicted GNAT superfamily acetyltransferase
MTHVETSRKAGAVVSDDSAANNVVVTPVPKHRLKECERLNQLAFGLRDIDVLPAHEMYTASLNGAMVLGAFCNDELLGFSFSYPGFDGRRTFLFSNGLVVRPESQGKGIAFKLKVAQRDNAHALGYDVIRWTVNALASRPLYLYLAKLRARITGYCPDMYDQILPRGRGDEVSIEWRLTKGCSTDDASMDRDDPVQVLTRSKASGDTRELTGWTEPSAMSLRNDDASYAVEIPWDLEHVRRRGDDVLKNWRAGVRATMEALLAGGYIGVDVLLDRRRRRSLVRFERRSAQEV